ncbi:hypothetical protein TSAR_014559, partial [Trichomalopsis sarcophagae]
PKPAKSSTTRILLRSENSYLELVNRSGAVLSLFNKNPSPVSSEMWIDRLSSAFVAFAKKCALKIDFSEIPSFQRNVSRSLKQLSQSFRKKILVKNRFCRV